MLLPVLPLRDIVAYPNSIVTLFVGRDKSIDALHHAIKENGQVLLVAQKQADIDSPDVADLYDVGTQANILQMLKLPDGNVKVLMEGEERSKVINYQKNDGFLCAYVKFFYETYNIDDHKKHVLESMVRNSFENYVKRNNKIPTEILKTLSEIDDPIRLADTIAAHMTLKVSDKQSILEMKYVEQRLDMLINFMEFKMQKEVNIDSSEIIDDMDNQSRIPKTMLVNMEPNLHLLSIEERVRNRIKHLVKFNG